MTPTKYVDRAIPEISLREFSSRIDEITAELVEAAENVGFFSIVDHGISKDEVNSIFEQSARFFNLPDDIKAKVPFSPKYNAGWEKNAQIRPSTGAVDRKESYQMQFGDGMKGETLSVLPSRRPSMLTGMQDGGSTRMFYPNSKQEHSISCTRRKSSARTSWSALLED
jgi:hypothetical protein